MQDDLLDFATDEAAAGFRLQRFEAYNWGTFGEQVWSIELDGKNALMTGDIGSGKSTLVDGLTTLLFPSHRITYNKAAGAERQERSPYTYVRGAYGATQDEATRQSKARFLRDEHQYSVLLAHFYNAGFDLHVSLAQVWWLKPGERNPSRFYVVAERPLGIKADFGDFGGELAALRRRLRRHERVAIEDSFERYSQRFQRLLTLRNRQALELFYQTVSMKSVGDLTDFVRQHMLEPGDIEETLKRLLGDFDNLNAAHEAVLKAERQIGHLRPIMTAGDQHLNYRREVELLRGDRDALTGWFAQRKLNLLHERLENVTLELAKREERRAALRAQLQQANERRTDLTVELRAAGGDRLERIERELRQCAEIREQRKQSAERYRVLAEQLELAAAASDHAFHRNRQLAEASLAEAKADKQRLESARVDHGVHLQEARKARSEIEQDIAMLKARRSNIPRTQLEIRAGLAEAVGVTEPRLPFAGELIEVREDEAAWEGAIERVLRSFALSLLVPEDLYGQVVRYVERTHLRGRLVYYRIAETARQSLPSLHPHSLVRKLNLKPDSEHYDWLNQELARRFDYACCDDVETFRRETDALTRAGQIKRGARRHEKDDRRALDDRSRYVLGWRVEAKLRALLARREEIEKNAQQVADRIAAVERQLDTLEARRDALKDLLRIVRYEDIHWQEKAREIERLEAEREQLRAASDRLRVLEKQLQALATEIENLTADQQRQDTAIGALREKHEDAERQLGQAEAVLKELDAELRARHFPRLDEHVPAMLEGAKLNLINLDSSERRCRDTLQAQADAVQKRLDRAREKLTESMANFHRDYPADTTDFDTRAEALPEYRRMLERLEQDDLPRHRERFHALLRENTIQGMALLQSRLDQQEKAIRSKVERINQSLHEVEYERGTFIRLQAEPALDVEIREFRREVRGILEGAFGTDETYSETRFLKVKALVERFRGRADYLEQDRRWVAKVIDVRNWFRFAASERWRADGSEKEYYPDSGGKSGGQKEKLAYTVLAASLAYQFGLEWGETRSRSFRFVVIDEAFGRGSDESTRYGLELFRKLNLQLLIVTPLQKVNVIEDYINAVHFVYKRSDECSEVRNLTLVEYQEEKARNARQDSRTLADIAR
jgi:uncharacterized protein YPO0396